VSGGGPGRPNRKVTPQECGEGGKTYSSSASPLPPRAETFNGAGLGPHAAFFQRIAGGKLKKGAVPAGSAHTQSNFYNGRQLVSPSCRPAGFGRGAEGHDGMIGWFDLLSGTWPPFRILRFAIRLGYPPYIMESSILLRDAGWAEFFKMPGENGNCIPPRAYLVFRNLK